MFKFRKEHLDAFAAQAAGFFCVRVVAHVQAVWPEECGELGAEAVAELVKKLVGRAAALGLSSEMDVARFVDLAFILAEDFETNPNCGWLKAVLADPKIPPAAKMDKLYQRLEEEFASIDNRKRGKP
jgi:hypothetical protein